MISMWENVSVKYKQIMQNYSYGIHFYFYLVEKDILFL